MTPTSPPSSMQCIALLGAKFACEDKTRVPDNPPSSLTGNITPQILDALASICVSKPGETFAVSLDVSSDNILLRIAGNSNVSPSVEKHLQNVWLLLRDFNREVPVIEPDRTPPLPLHDGPIQSRLCFEIYRFSLAKLKSRVRKHIDDVLKDLDSLKQLPGFPRTLKALRIVKEQFPREQRVEKNDDQIRHICTMLSAIYENIHPILQRITQVPLSESDYALYTTLPRRGLGKILSLHQHIMTLCRIPRSPTRQYILSRNLIIRRVPNSPISYSLDLPTTLPNELSAHFFPPTASSLPAAVNEKAIVETLESWRGIAMRKIMPKRADRQDSMQITAPVHAECAMLLDLRMDDSIIRRSYYIGVSKLSCLSCQLFFKTFSTSCATDFQTKGSHGKVYLNWGDPCSIPWTAKDEERKDDVRLRLNDALQNMLKNSLINATTYSRPSSDSTAASKTSDVQVVPDDEFERAAAALEEQN